MQSNFKPVDYSFRNASNFLPTQNESSNVYFGGAQMGKIKNNVKQTTEFVLGFI